MCILEDEARQLGKGKNSGSLVFEMRCTTFLVLPGYCTMETDALSSILAVTTTCMFFPFAPKTDL